MQRDIATSVVDINHHIQRQILLALRQKGPSTYAQLKPDGLELKKIGLVMQESDQYRLSTTGQLVEDAFHLAREG